MKNLGIITLSLLLTLSIAAYDYSDQANWGDECNVGMEQSPIDIDFR